MKLLRTILLTWISLITINFEFSGTMQASEVDSVIISLSIPIQCIDLDVVISKTRSFYVASRDHSYNARDVKFLANTLP